MIRRRSTLALALLAFAVPAWGDEIVVPAPGLQRDRAYDFVYRPDRPLTGRGALAIEWIDVHGRVVEHRTQALTLTRDAAVGFALDLRRAAAMKNRVEARLTVDAVAVDGVSQHYEGRAGADFIATPPDDPWRDYQVMMWQGKTARQYAGLKALGISAGMIVANRAAPGAELSTPVAAALLDNDLRWYVENIATDFYAAYHRWTPDRPVNFQYLEARRRYRANPGDRTALMREPSLVDPAWLARVQERLTTVARLHAPYAPLHYSLGDEPGIAELSANWDFDFGPLSLAGFRDWLRGRYASLAALNRQWGARYAGWDAIVPPTTTEAMKRRDQNYSAWSDFKEWMDESFVRAVRRGVDAVHAGDKRGRAALEGMQVPGWGGYDYARLAPALDLMEIYDVGGNTDIAASLHPRAVRLVTGAAGGRGEAFRLWRHVLRGGRGVVLWDEDDGFVDTAGAPVARGQTLAAQFRELRAGLGALMIGAEPQVDRIVILYSPPSIRARWMLDYRSLGDRWIERDAEREHEDETAYRAAMTGFIDAARGAGFQPYVVTEEQMARGFAGPEAPRLLILPQALALSDEAAAQIRRFAAGGGIVIADIVPGRFDEHAKRRARPILADLFAAKRSSNAVLIDPTVRPVAVASLRALVGIAGLAPVASVVDAQGAPAEEVEVYAFRQGEALLLGLIAARAPANDEAAKPRDVQVKLTAPLYARDLRVGRDLGHSDRIAVTLDPWSPTVLALTRSPAADPAIEAPARIKAGETASIAIRLAPPASLLRIDVIDPRGKVVSHYGGKIDLREGRAVWPVPFALNDVAGSWEVRAVDPLGGRAATARIELLQPW